ATVAVKTGSAKDSSVATSTSQLVAPDGAFQTSIGWRSVFARGAGWTSVQGGGPAGRPAWTWGAKKSRSTASRGRGASSTQRNWAYSPPSAGRRPRPPPPGGGGRGRRGGGGGGG